MPTFVIKTADPSVDFAIEAEDYQLTRDNVYVFYDEDDARVAELSAEWALAVINEENLLVPQDADEDDVCDDCRTQELLDDPAFVVDAVLELIDCWHESDENTPPAALGGSIPEANQQQGPPAELGEEAESKTEANYPIELRFWRSSKSPMWGIVDVERGHFVPFGPHKDTAEENLQHYINSPTDWSVIPLSECSLVGVPADVN